MGSFNHVLKANISQSFPRNWLFFDCESFLNDQPDGKQIHTFRLAVGFYVRDGRKKNPRQTCWHETQSAKEFWAWVLTVCEPDRQLVCLAYNLPYDIRIANVFNILSQAGYSQTSVYISGKVTIIGFRRGKHKITFIDAMNYFDGKLADWGKLFGLAKFDVDFSNVTTEKLFRHCTRDVEVLYHLWCSWREFVKAHNLGHFAPTRASQSLRAFTHRFMSKEIFIHANSEILELERESYCGGRVEAYKIGDCGAGPFYKLDFNSMYPFIMRTLPVPVRLLGVRRTLKLADLVKWQNKYGFVAQVRLQTSQPVYPIRHEHRLVFPIGTFEATLAGPELTYAVSAGHVKSVGLVAVYETAVIFRRYVDYFYGLRKKYPGKKNVVYNKLCKYLMNSLYGKFGQHSENWVTVENEPFQEDGTYPIYDVEKRKWYNSMILAGQRWDMLGKKESYHSFPAISAWITSAARLYLWQIMTMAACENVFYCDTDSVFVNTTGRRNLRKMIDATRLGLLKQEYRTKRLTIYGLKDYVTDRESIHKGITDTAEKLSEGVYRQFHWQQLRGSISKGNLNSVVLRPVEKHLSRHYFKGQVSASGSVSPIVLAS